LWDLKNVAIFLRAEMLDDPSKISFQITETISGSFFVEVHELKARSLAHIFDSARYAVLLGVLVCFFSWHILIIIWSSEKENFGALS
jgi:hypothetical protein